VRSPQGKPALDALTDQSLTAARNALAAAQLTSQEGET
jgi:hypothetical protein